MFQWLIWTSFLSFHSNEDYRTFINIIQYQLSDIKMSTSTFNIYKQHLIFSQIFWCMVTLGKRPPVLADCSVTSQRGKRRANSLRCGVWLMRKGMLNDVEMVTSLGHWTPKSDSDVPFTYDILWSFQSDLFRVYWTGQKLADFFHLLFRDKILDLTAAFPADARIMDPETKQEPTVGCNQQVIEDPSGPVGSQDKGLFWSGHKRFPNATSFDLENETHWRFLEAQSEKETWYMWQSWNLLEVFPWRNVVLVMMAFQCPSCWSRCGNEAASTALFAAMLGAVPQKQEGDNTWCEEPDFLWHVSSSIMILWISVAKHITSNQNFTVIWLRFVSSGCCPFYCCWTLWNKGLQEESLGCSTGAEAESSWVCRWWREHGWQLVPSRRLPSTNLKVFYWGEI